MKRFLMSFMLVLMAATIAWGSTIQYVLTEFVPQEICGPEYAVIGIARLNNNGHMTASCTDKTYGTTLRRYLFINGDTGETVYDDRIDGIVDLDDKNVVTFTTGLYPDDIWYQWDADTGEVWRRDAHILPETENGIYIINRYGLSTSDNPPSVWSKPFGLQEVPRPTDRECKSRVGYINEWDIFGVSEAYLTWMRCYGGTSYNYDYIYDMITEEVKPLCKSCTRGAIVTALNSHGEAIASYHGEKWLMDLRTMETIRSYADCDAIGNSLNNKGDTLCDYNGPPPTWPLAIARRDGTIDYISMEVPPGYISGYPSQFNDKEQFIVKFGTSDPRYFLAEPAGTLP